MYSFFSISNFLLITSILVGSNLYAQVKIDTESSFKQHKVKTSNSKMINPQPEPPGKVKYKMINPQPEPPGKIKHKMINPQPEPPGKF